MDERLSSSCCSYSTVVDTIYSLLQVIQLIESDQLGVHKGVLDYGLVRYLDRVWIEVMLYRLESQPPHAQHKRDLTQQFRQLVSEATPKGSGQAVFIGEMDYLQPMLEILDVPKLPRPPRVNEIYSMKNPYGVHSWSIKYLGTLTPRNFTGQEAE